jgi:hypothetical protein
MKNRTKLAAAALVAVGVGAAMSGAARAGVSSFADVPWDEKSALAALREFAPLSWSEKLKFVESQRALHTEDCFGFSEGSESECYRVTALVRHDGTILALRETRLSGLRQFCTGIVTRMECFFEGDLDLSHPIVFAFLHGVWR